MLNLGVSNANKCTNFDVKSGLKLLVIFLTYETELALLLAVLENSALPVGSHEALKVTSVVYKRSIRAVTKNAD